MRDVVLKKPKKVSPQRSATSNVRVLSNRGKQELLDMSPLVNSIRIGGAVSVMAPI
jgi:hypothetical protein